MPTPPSPPSTAASGPLSHAIFTLARAHRGHAAAMLRDLGLHPGQELLLMQLLDRDGQTQSELLESVGLDHSTVSKSLRRMQEAGLLTREPAAHDRRVMVVHLTDRGRDMREPLERMWSVLEDVSVRDLNPEDVATFVRLARVIETSIAERPQRENGAEPA
ncbi:MarR family winged helix-turn-helix transcriptional regulator [Streptomyces sparsus]